MGAYETLVDFTITSNVVNVEITGLKITKDDFILIRHTATRRPVSSFPRNIYVNEDTTPSNYHTQFINGDGTSFTAFTISEPRLMFVNDQKNAFNFAYLKLSKSGHVNIIANADRETTDLLRREYNGITSLNTFNEINKLTFNIPTGNADNAGGRIQIYRLAAEKVADINVSSNTNRVDITGLDIKKGDEYLLVSHLENYTDQNGFFNLVANDISPSNHNRQRLMGSESSLSGARTTSAEPSNTNSSGPTFMYSYIKLTNIGSYASHNYSILGVGSNSAVLQHNSITVRTENINSINQLSIIAVSGFVLISGSRFELYKLYEGGN